MLRPLFALRDCAADEGVTRCWEVLALVDFLDEELALIDLVEDKRVEIGFTLVALHALSKKEYGLELSSAMLADL